MPGRVAVTYLDKGNNMKTHWAPRLVSLIAILGLQISSVYPQSRSTAKRPDVRLFSSTKVIKGDGIAGRIPKFIDTDVIADSVIIELSGSIGIGTTAWADKNR